MLCKKCGRPFTIKRFFVEHEKKCNCSKDDIIKIRQLYDDGHSVKFVIQQGFSKYDVDFALKGRRRSLAESLKIEQKEYPRHQSEEDRRKRSKALKSYYKKHPEKLPYRLRHSSNVSFIEEMLATELKKRNVNFVRHYRIGLYEYDIALPKEKIDIEVDGHTHKRSDVIKKDHIRDQWSIKRGWKVIRFSASFVKRDVQKCIDKILQAIDANSNQPDIERFEYFRKTADRRRARKQKALQEKRNAVLQFRSEILKTVNMKKFGCINELASKWGVSHTQVRRILKKDFPD